jgi:hypothetical protein
MGGNMSHTPIAYTFDAEYHCEACTVAVFGRSEDGWVAWSDTEGEEPRDSERNPVGAVFSWDEWWEASDWHAQTLICATCGAELDTTAANLDYLIEQARAIGRDHGQNAASWYFEGGAPRDIFKTVLRGIEEGDPEVYDTFPANPLSGEWADGYLPQTLYSDLGIEEGDLDGFELDELCDQYVDAYDVEVSRDIEAQCRAALA